MSLEQGPEQRAARRVLAAVEEVRVAATAVGLDAERIGELYAPLDLRIDAWCWRVERDTEDWQRLLAAPLFSRARSPQVAV